MSSKYDGAIANVIGIDIGKSSFHIIGQDRRGEIVVRQKWSREKSPNACPTSRPASPVRVKLGRALIAQMFSASARSGHGQHSRR